MRRRSILISTQPSSTTLASRASPDSRPSVSRHCWSCTAKRTGVRESSSAENSMMSRKRSGARSSSSPIPIPITGLRKISARRKQTTRSSGPPPSWRSTSKAETDMASGLRALLAVLVLLALLPAAQAAEISGKTMTLPATERQVKVVYFRAPGDAKCPSALLLHGGGGFDRRIADYNRYASALASEGIDAYLVYYYSDADERGMSSPTGFDIFTSRYAAWAK